MKLRFLAWLAASLLCSACTQTHGVSLGSAAAKPSDQDAGTDDPDHDDDDDPRHEEGEHHDGIFSDDGASIGEPESTTTDAGEVETEDSTEP